MEVVELREGEDDQAQEDHPRLPAVELVGSVEDGPDQQLDGRFGNQQAMRRQHSATSVSATGIPRMLGRDNFASKTNLMYP